MRAGRKDTSHPIVERRSHSEIARRAASADIEAVQYALRASAGWLCERSPNRMKRQRPGTRAYMRCDGRRRSMVALLTPIGVAISRTSRCFGPDCERGAALSARELF